jgi:dynein heavy chain 2
MCCLKPLSLSALQLYKALQYQYRKGLDALNESLPQMSVKLVFKQKKLQFEPGFEEIRQAHFREIQKFLK